MVPESAAVITTLSSTISDNYFYLVHDRVQGVLIDPIDAPTAIDAVDRAGIELCWLVNTHFHPDHVGGNDEVLARFPAAMLAAGPDHSRIGGRRVVDRVLLDGDVLAVGELRFAVIETPGHTAGHISLRRGDDLFSGDTIFVAGTGHCRFGGDPATLYRTFRDVLGKLADHTRFYPGHDYAKRNLEFALALEPDQPAVRAKLALVGGPDADHPTLTTLGEERRHNPFFRAGDSSLQAAVRAAHPDIWQAERALSTDDAEATFRALRTLRNTW